MSTVYDCFCYFNEDMLLELRLETLWEHVDWFVISEASYSHAGVARQTQFDIKRFDKYASKIRYIRLDQRPEGPNDFWKNENFIRNNLTKGLFDAQPNDLILISDLDEIPNPEKIKEYQPRYLRGDFDQRYYSYFLNNYWLGDVDEKGILKPNSNIWRGSKITTYRHFMDFFKGNATSVRSYKSSGIWRSIKRAWFRQFNVQLLKNGGWHFTWVFTMENLVKKIENTAHQEYNKKEYKEPIYIERMIRAGKDFHKPNSRYQAQLLDHQFPEYLVQHADKFREFLLDASAS
jgi:beta-1,4-mannosyl-glycoprotein beta-1,4-N-acetylglucosaminyltransferase